MAPAALLSHLESLVIRTTLLCLVTGLARALDRSLRLGDTLDVTACLGAPSRAGMRRLARQAAMCGRFASDRSAPTLNRCMTGGLARPCALLNRHAASGLAVLAITNAGIPASYQLAWTHRLLATQRISATCQNVILCTLVLCFQLTCSMQSACPLMYVH